MPSYKIGGKTGKKVNLNESADRVVVRTKDQKSLEEAIKTDAGKSVLKQFEIEQEIPDASVTVLKKVTGDTTRDQARVALKGEEDLKFAGRVLEDENTGKPVLYTENFFIKFHDEVSEAKCLEILKNQGLQIKQRLEFATNSYFVQAAEGTGMKVFDIASEMLELPEIELCHPELIRKKGRKTIHPKQWHLAETTIQGHAVKASVHADKAHLITRGAGVTVAIIDDGVDIDNPEFAVPGKVVASLNVTNNKPDSRPRLKEDNHGTACAGVAVAAGIKASGVAPDARLIAVRNSAELGSVLEASAFKWATDQGADIISCSWGPPDGAYNDPEDPAHTEMSDLPDHTRLAIDYAVKKGRNGKGTVVLFAAGNGNEDTRFDGYASYENVIAVSACNDTGKRSIYSDFGSAVWCCFPSSDWGDPDMQHPDALTKGIYTTDRTNGKGYKSNSDYTDDFGGTSSACPGAAGVAALILSVNPSLTRDEVRQLLKDCAEIVDSAGGVYDAKGHSKYYGYGRLNAEKAVQLATASLQRTGLKILKAMVNPAGNDRGNEVVVIQNPGNSDADISNWQLRTGSKTEKLQGMVKAGHSIEIRLSGSLVQLTNTGGSIALYNSQGSLVHEVSYKKADVKEGEMVLF